MGRRYKIRCRECRRRKVKCGAEQPRCLRCSHDGVACSGYEDEHYEFVHKTILDLSGGGSSKTQKAPIVIPKAKQIPTPPQSPPRHLQRISPRASPRSSRESSQQPHCSSITQFTPTGIPTPPNARGLRITQIHSSMMQGRFPFVQFSPPNTSSMTWFLNLPDFINQNVLLDYAVAAVCLVHIAKTRRDINALRMARLSYGATLRCLQVASTRGRYTYLLLLVINLIGVYELYDSVLEKGSGWIKQVQGAQSLCAELAPTYDSPPMHHTSYLRFRTLAIYNSFAGRKACSLASYQRAIFSENASSFSDFSEELEDITIHIPEIIELSDTLFSATDEESSEIYIRICTRWHEFAQELQAWHHKLLHHWGSFSFDTTLSPSALAEFGPSYTFPSFWVSQAFTHYWTVRLDLLDALKQAIEYAAKHLTISFPPPLSPHPSTQTSARYFSDPAYPDHTIATLLSSPDPKYEELTLLLTALCDDSARNITRSIHYQYFGSLGTLAMLRPVNSVYMASRYFKKRNMVEELLLCAKATDQLAARGLVVGKLLELSSDEYRRIMQGRKVAGEDVEGKEWEKNGDQVPRSHRAVSGNRED